MIAVDGAEFKDLEVFESPCEVRLNVVDIESLVLDEKEPIEDSEFGLSVCNVEVNEPTLFEEGKIVVEPGGDTVNVKASVVVVPAGKVDEKKNFIPVSDVFDNEDSTATFVCKEAEFAGTVEGWVSLVRIFETTELIAWVDFKVLEVEIIAAILLEALIEDPTEAFEDSNDDLRAE